MQSFCLRTYLISFTFFVGISLLWCRDFGMRLGINTMLRGPEFRKTEMKAAAGRIAELRDTIEQLMSIGGTVGVALGVLHHGEIISTETFGYRDAELKYPIDDETVFAGASLTKAVVSAAMGILVEEDKIQWDTPIKDVLSQFKTLDSTLGNLTTVTDILSHRTGMSTSNYWLGSNNNVLIDKKDSMTFLNSQRLVKPFRGQFQYNNLGYELAGHVIEEITGSRWSELIQTKIFQPLNMKRTSFRAGVVQDANVAKAYGTLDDGKATKLPGVKLDDEHFGGANGGIRTCIKDLMQLYASLFDAVKQQFGIVDGAVPDTPIRQAAKLISSNIALTPTSFHEQSYAFGWARVQLPGPMGAVGLNPKLMPDGMPLVGKGTSRLVLYHQGSLPGALAAVNLVPEIDSAVVVLTNSLALNDCADWIGQAVLEALLDVKDKNDYVQLAKKSVTAALSWYPDLAKELDSERSAEPPPRDLSDYVGTFTNDIETMKIVISLEKGQLSVAFQGLESESYSLAYIRGDEFSWLQPRNELAKRGRFTHQKALYYKLRFYGNHENIQELSWTHDADIPEGERFFKAK